MEREKVEINGVTYVQEDSITKNAEQLDGLDYVLVRADRAGVFCGYLEERKGSEVILRQCRRLWYWNGAASLSQLAVDGVKKPDDCKFPVAVSRQEILGVIEVLPMTKKARESILDVSEWQA